MCLLGKNDNLDLENSESRHDEQSTVQDSSNQEISIESPKDLNQNSKMGMN